jgi:hypothetical protein
MKNGTLGTVLLIIACLLILLVHLSTNNFDFSRYNIEWNGTSAFFDLPDRHNLVEITDLNMLSGKINTTLLVLTPTKKYSKEDFEKYRKYVEEGNTLFLADDYGTGYTLLEGIGANITILYGTLASIDKAYNDSYLIVANPARDHPLTNGVSTIVLDKAAALEGGDPIIQSSILSWVDEDGDGRITDEEMAKYPVLVNQTLGKGEVMVLSDPSVFINGMGKLEDKWGNEQFIRDFISTYPNLLVDQVNSESGSASGISSYVKIIRMTPALKVLLGVLVLFLLALLIRKKII